MKFLRVNGLWHRCVSKLWECGDARAHSMYCIHTLPFARNPIYNVLIYIVIFFITKCWMFWCMLPTTLLTGISYAFHPYTWISIQNNKSLECWLWIVDCMMQIKHWALNTQHSMVDDLMFQRRASHMPMIIIIIIIYISLFRTLCGSVRVIFFFGFLILKIVYDSTDKRMKWKDKNNKSGHQKAKQ